MSTPQPDPMQTLLDALVERAADQVGDRLAQRIEEVLTDALQSLRTPSTPSGGTLICGINPYGLYTAAAVAELCGYDRVQTVRDMDAEALPRAGWLGPGIRYRGVDILRLLGVAEAALLPTNVQPLQAPLQAPRPLPRPAAAAGTAAGAAAAPALRRTSGKRPYNANLPAL